MAMPVPARLTPCPTCGTVRIVRRRHAPPLLVLLVAIGCRLEPAAVEPGAPGSTVAAPTPVTDDAAGDATGGPAGESSEDPEPEEGPRTFGYEPGQVAVISWVRGSKKNSGLANLRLPTGEMLSGRWTEIDNRAPVSGGRVISTSPAGDPGDPTSMPAAPPPASQMHIRLEGERGTRVECTVPTGPRAKSKVGTCRASGARTFRARLQ